MSDATVNRPTGADPSPQSRASRRGWLKGAAAAALAAPFTGAAWAAANLGDDPEQALKLIEQSAFCSTGGPNGGPILNGPPRKITFAWNSVGVCLTPIAVAKQRGFFERQNLDVTLVEFGGSTEQFLDAVATGKCDAGIGMALRWLKPMEQGFDVKITAGTHGGCLRLLAKTRSGITQLTDLKGKTIAVADMSAVGKTFFAIALQKVGLDPEKDVEWRQFPDDQLRVAVEKGDAHALVDADPQTYLWLKDGTFTEVASNLQGEFEHRVCCILGLGGSLIREQPLVAKALTLAVLDASRFTLQNPVDATQSYLPYGRGATAADLEAMVRYHTHGHNPVGAKLKREIALYANELKQINVLKQTTDAERFADRVYADVLST